jgi:hypothetical protein
MWGFGEARDAYDQVQGYDQNQGDNQASLSHELIAGAASFEVRITPHLPPVYMICKLTRIILGHEGI